jgi:CheY-like chemotaxis protein
MSDESNRLRKKGSGRHPLVLIVEEEESIRALLHRVLEAEGCAVLAAIDAAEAIVLLESHPDAVDLVIADIAEPGIRGRGGLMHLLAPTTKLFLLSIGTTAPMDSREDGEGIPILLHRPFRSNVLLEKVREVLGDTGASSPQKPRQE